jgi:hypothetical protein
MHQQRNNNNMQAQSMLGDSELMAAGRQGDAMNFDGNYEEDSSNMNRRPQSNIRNR